MKANNKEENKVYHSFVIKRAKAFEGGSVSFDLVIDGWITIYNMRVVEGKNGDFISFPKRRATDGNYYSYVWFKMDDNDQKAILEKVQEVLDGK